MAFPLLLIPAILSAAAAAGQGIAGAVQSGEAAEASKANSAANRALQTKLAKMQIAFQREEQAKAQQQNALQSLSSLYGARADQATQIAAKQGAANSDAMSTLAKAFIHR
jgi:hypothetical protein